MITLYQYPGIWGMPSLSPFCSKVFYFLIWAKLPFETMDVYNPRKSPTGKFPVIDDQGVLVADSELIIAYCRERYGLNIEDPIDDLPIRRLLEEHLYFIILYSRWIDPENRSQIEKAFQPFLPRGMTKLILTHIVGRQLRKQGYFQGISRHNRDHIYQKGLDDLRAIEQFLIARKDKNCRVIDMSLYAFLEVIQQTPLDIPIRKYLMDSEPLQAYLQSMSKPFNPG